MISFGVFELSHVPFYSIRKFFMMVIYCLHHRFSLGFPGYETILSASPFVSAGNVKRIGRDIIRYEIYV